MMHKRISLLGAFALAFMLMPLAGVHAITLSPPDFNFELNPGDVALDTVELFNESSMAITMYPRELNFEATEDEGGSPQIYGADENRGGYALTPWLEFDDAPITLEPGARISFPFTINVPGKDLATPGGHYGVLSFPTTPQAQQQEGAQVALGQEIGALILVSVGGDVIEQGSIVEFGFEQKKPWYNSRPIDMFVRFENGGNTHLRPTGNVVIKNWFGRNVAQPKVNEDYRSILPHSTRKFVVSWEGEQLGEVEGFFNNLRKEWRNFAIGRYQAELILTYGSSNSVLMSTRSFTVWPWRVMLVTAILVFVVASALFLWKRQNDRNVIRRYERRRG